MGRRFGGDGPAGASGVPLPPCSGNGTPVRGGGAPPHDGRGRTGAGGRGRVVGQGRSGGAPPTGVVADRPRAGAAAGPAGVVAAAAVPAGARSGLRPVPDADGLRLPRHPPGRGPRRLPELVPPVQGVITPALGNRRSP